MRFLLFYLARHYHGGASGIGIETARAFANIGADVTLAVRNLAAAAPVVAELVESTRNQEIHAELLDLADRATIASFVEKWNGPLHVLVNNAGIMALPDLQRTAQGWEMQFATNYLGHFALATGLYKALAEAGNARVVSLSSSGHLFSPVIFDDLHFNFVPYDPFVAYGQSKTATALFAVGATKRWARDGITSNAVCLAPLLQTCSATPVVCAPRWSAGSPRSRVQLQRSSSRPHRYLTVSEGDILGTATRLSASAVEIRITPVLHLTPSTRKTLIDCGTSRWPSCRKAETPD